jgi:hypothetical protein
VVVGDGFGVPWPRTASAAVDTITSTIHTRAPGQRATRARPSARACDRSWGGPGAMSEAAASVCEAHGRAGQPHYTCDTLSQEPRIHARAAVRSGRSPGRAHRNRVHPPSARGPRAPWGSAR